MPGWKLHSYLLRHKLILLRLRNCDGLELVTRWLLLKSVCDNFKVQCLVKYEVMLRCHSVAWMLLHITWWCYNTVTTLLQQCYNIVTALQHIVTTWQHCYNITTMMLQHCYNNVTTLLQHCNTLLQHRNIVTTLQQWCCNIVTTLLQHCYIATDIQLHLNMVTSLVDNIIYWCPR